MSATYPGGLITKTPVTPADGVASGIWTLAEQAYWQKQGVWTAQPDPYFENVSLLLNGDGTNGAQNNTFLDSSTNNFTITRNGNTTQGSFSPYGSNWGNYFDGSGDYLSTPNSANLVLNASDFTVECWVNVSTLAALQRVMVWSNGTGSDVNYSWTMDIQTSGIPRTYIGSVGAINAASALTINTWNHIAIVRNGSSVTVYLNGVGGTSSSPSIQAVSDGTLTIGADRSGGSPTTGYISNLRILKGTALYTADFTPPTAPLTAITNTQLLTCKSNRFFDNSSNNFTITVNGTPSIQRFSPFNPTAPYSTSVIGGSGYFDGSGDYLTTPNVTALNIYNTTNTVECWFYPLSFSTDTQIYGSNFDGTDYNRWRLTDTNGYPDYLSRFGTQITGSTGAKLNQWNHIAFGRSGSTMSIWLNGVRVANATILVESAWGTGNIIVGGFETSGRANGYMSNLRVVKGTDVYGVSNTTITVPTSPVTAIANTAFLLNSTNAGIPDLAMMNNLETVGNAQVSTSVKKYGTGSLSFNGTNSYVTLQPSQNYNFGSGNFTVEFWMNPGQVTAQQAIFDTENGPYYSLTIWLLSTGKFRIDVSTNGTTVTQIAGNTALLINNWYHIALVRVGTAFSLYINGNLDVSSTISGSIYYTGTTPFIGARNQLPLATSFFYTGNIDDLRITKNLARYTTNFTPPASALPKF